MPRSRPWRLFVPLLLLGALRLPATPVPDPALFPIPDSLRDNVAFWSSIYGRYTTHQRLLHDREHLEVVYAVIDFTELEAGSTSEANQARIRHKEIEKAERRYRELLRQLGRGVAPETSPELQRVARLLQSVPGGREKYRMAADRLRTQRGQRDRFEEGIARSGGYMSRIERIFERRGVPAELSRLVFVESMFQLEARSSAQAVGIWQFVSSTGGRYLTISSEVDERLDPLLASDAAARLLRDNFDQLGHWPLAVTAYNYGTNGMRRAVSKLGTRDLGEIVARHRTRLFGFASKNFYAEFVAAARVYAERERLFPGVKADPPLQFDRFVPERFVSLPALADRSGTPIDELKLLNPGLADRLWMGALLHPGGRTLRIPPGSEQAFRTAWSQLPEGTVADRQAGLYYSVRRGDTLGSIARRHGTSVATLQKANRLPRPDRIHVGQRLFIPISGARATHVVLPGDTLASIAQRYRTSVDALRAANSIVGHLIYPRQTLVIP